MISTLGQLRIGAVPFAFLALVGLTLHAPVWAADQGFLGCTGDCNRDGRVSASEIVQGIIELGNSNGDAGIGYQAGICPELDLNRDCAISASEVDQGVAAVFECSPSAGAQTPPFFDGENRSCGTICAEQDNVHVPLFPQTSFPILPTPFKVVATHPMYSLSPPDSSCPPDSSGCLVRARAADNCQALGPDDPNVPVEVCTTDWWRNETMNVVMGDRMVPGHYLRIYKKIEGVQSFPQVLVLYEDGNMRLKPHPPEGLSDVCFGSSVIIGPATLTHTPRPYAAIQEVRVDRSNPSSVLLDVTYRPRTPNDSAEVPRSARITLLVDRARAIAQVDMSSPFDTETAIAVFSSMWVEDGNADVDHIRTQDSDIPILTGWNYLRSSEFFFYRRDRSRHNPSAPDMNIDAGMP